MSLGQPQDISLLDVNVALKYLNVNVWIFALKAIEESEFQYSLFFFFSYVFSCIIGTMENYAYFPKLPNSVLR